MTQPNPIDLPCFITCSSCFRCSDKGKYAKCANCSGRNDPTHKINPEDYYDDRCDCKNGVLRWRTKKGQLIIAKIPGDPFAGKVVKEKETADERDYNSYIAAQRERTGNETFDPINYDQTGAGSLDWYESYKAGKGK